MCSLYVLLMPLTVADMISEDALLEVRCSDCGKVVRFRGSRLLGRFPKKLSARQLQARLSCERCGMTGEIRLLFPAERLSHERLARGVSVHSVWKP